MLNIKRLLFLASLFLCLSAKANLTDTVMPYAQGNSTTATVTCTLQVSGANGYAVILDGTLVATSTITVAVQVWDPIQGAWITPVTIGGVTQPITLTNATAQVVNIPGSFPGIRVNVTSFGTATGTFYAYISAD